MLILSVKFGEKIMIHDDITITALGARGYEIELGILAPQNVPVQHEAIYGCPSEDHVYDDGTLSFMCVIGEAVTIGSNIRIVPIDLQGGQVKIGIEAPEKISILRAK